VTRERLTTIWSLLRREEIPVRIYYTVVNSGFPARRGAGRCRIFQLKLIEELEP
jgi:hypothetical protein